MKKCPSYKNEINLIKRLETARKNQENEILLLKKKVNSLCNFIEDNKNFKENVIKKKDKLISYLQKEKIKNQNTIKKLKTQLKKEKNQNNNNKEKKNIIISKNKTKINNDNDNIKTEITSDNKNNKNIIKNIIYEKKNYQYNENLKKKSFRKSIIPYKINIDLTNTINHNPLIRYQNETYENKNKGFIKENTYSSNKKLSSTSLKSTKLNDDKALKKNVSEFNDKNKRLKMNNLLYIPKKSKLPNKFILYGNNKADILGRSKSITNLNSIVLKLNGKNNQLNKDINSDIVKETISLNESNYFNETINKKEDISMSLNLSPIEKNYNKDIILSIEDYSIYDLFKTKNNKNENNINTVRKNYIYNNKLKLDIIDIGNKNKLSLSPKLKKSNEQNIYMQKNFFYAKDYFNMWNISFIILNEKINIILNKDTLLLDVIDSIINKIKLNNVLYKKFYFIIENKENLIFLGNNIILDKNKTLEENKLCNNSKIFVIMEL